MKDPVDNSRTRLRIEQVVSDVHRLDAGPSYSVTRLSEELAPSADVTLHALEPDPGRYIEIDARFYPRLSVAPSLGISRAMKRGLRDAAAVADIMHVNGLWMMPNVYPSQAVAGTDCRLVMSPHGMLDPWALSWSSRRKAIFGRLLQYAAIDRVDCFHATSHKEAESIREAGYSAPIAVIPIGIDLPAETDPPKKDRRRLLYLGRLHPVKNVEGLLRAWAAVQHRHADWELIISGPGDQDYVSMLQRLAGNDMRVSFVGPIFGDAKSEQLSSADLFVLPTHSENFGIVVAEALSYGIPVISSTGAPWQGLETHDCGWWVSADDDALASALDVALDQDQSYLKRMGLNGRSWMERDFVWSAVAESTLAIYRWLATGDLQPDCVETS